MLNHINHKMSIYKDCTLGEVMTITIASFVILTLGLSIFSKLFLGYVWPGYLSASALFVFVTRFVLSKLQKMKYGKPYGYYQHWMIRKLIEYGIIRGVYLTRIGKWSVRRFLNEHRDF